jgi:hypothetical protein
MTTTRQEARIRNRPEPPSQRATASLKFTSKQGSSEKEEVRHMGLVAIHLAHH